VTPRRTQLAVPWLLSAPAAALLLALFAGPLLLLLRVSLYESSDGGTGFYRPGTWTLRAYGELLGEPFGRGTIAFTVALGAAVAALSVLIGYPPPLGKNPLADSKLWNATPVCFKSFALLMRAAADRTFCTAGSSRPMRTAMIAITTSNSIRVKPRR
jgi:hypothetical protein